jgi:N4-gp56 family major capsid protein
MPMTTGSQNVGTSALLPSYWAITHPDVAYNISKLTGFVSVQNYAGQTATVVGEYGYYGLAGRGVRFVMSEDASINLGDGAPLSGADLRSTSSNTDVYTIVVYGQDAFGSVGLGKRHTDGIYRAGDNTGGWEMIFKGMGSGGTSDPFNEISTLAWKAWFAGAVLNANWSRAILVGATNLSN